MCVLLCTATMVVLCKNPIYSVFFLILCFFTAACILLLIGFEYIPMAFLIIYVGAIAILFIFVIMLLNIRISTLKATKLNFVPIILIFLSCVLGCFVFASGFTIVSLTYLNICVLSTNSITDIIMPLLSINTEANAHSIATALFIEYYVFFIVSSLILLVAMVGAIILTLKHDIKKKAQSITYQVLKTPSFS